MAEEYNDDRILTSSEIQSELHKNDWDAQSAEEQTRNVKEKFALDMLSGMGDDIRSELRRPTSALRHKKPLKMRISAWFSGLWERLMITFGGETYDGA